MSDTHYRSVESTGVEPIRAMETAIIAGIPVEYHEAVIRNLNIAQAIKYQLRCCSKDDPAEELRKAQNYLHRAQHKCWPWEIDTNKDGVGRFIVNHLECAGR